MLAGHDECDGEIFNIDDKQYKRFYGMSSTEAMTKYHGSVADYRSSEGKSVNVPYRGPVENTILDILGGVRSSCTYVGARRLKELSKRTTFVRVTQQLNETYKALEID
jgi:GMP reductase